MACKRWSFDAHNSFSIGEVMSFVRWDENITNGLKIQLTRGYKCWNKIQRKYQSPVTNILMQCDLNADIGFPEALDNKAGIYSSQLYIYLLFILECLYRRYLSLFARKYTAIVVSFLRHCLSCVLHVK